MNLRISEQHHKLVRQVTSPSFLKGVELRPETGCILLVAQNECPENPCFLVTEALLPGSDEVGESSRDGLVFSASFLRRALLRVRERRQAGFLTVHTHPLADERVAFSSYDDAQDPKLMFNLHELQPTGVFGSLVLGQKAVAGRIWPVGQDQPAFLDQLMIIGETLETMSLRGEPIATATASEVFDRAVALTDAGALSRLSQMRIGVVGAGGTGSLVIELLARAGAGEIVVFDFDVAEKSNLNRVLHLREEDVLALRSKADRLHQVITESGLPTRMTVTEGGNITHAGVARELAGCDFIVGCVDSDWPRLVMCEVAYQFLIPLIDVGTEIGVSDIQVQSVDTRVSIVGPGRPCLICSGVVSRDRVRLEGYSHIEQDRVLKMGYSADIRLKAPAVMDLNMRAASMAMLVIRHFLQPYLSTPLPHTIKEAVTNFSMRALQHAICGDCAICGTAERIGIGNGQPLAQGLIERNAAPEVREIEEEASRHHLDSLQSAIVASENRQKDLQDEVFKTGSAYGTLLQEFDRLEASDESTLQAQKAEDALGRVRPALAHYLRLQLASEVLHRAIESYREKHQGPVLNRASDLFSSLTLGDYSGLTTGFGDNDKSVLLAIRRSKENVEIDGLSDGTRDQLYLALRLAAIEHHVETVSPCPVILDDILINADNARASAALKVLSNLASRTQVLFFTHHRHLGELGKDAGAQIVDLNGSSVASHTCVWSAGAGIDSESAG